MVPWLSIAACHSQVRPQLQLVFRLKKDNFSSPFTCKDTVVSLCERGGGDSVVGEDRQE